MKTKNRFVFDTNVIISAALIKRSISRKAFDKALDNGVILTSLPAFIELKQVLQREKFNKYLRQEERKQFLAAFIREAQFVEITEPITACRDPEDDIYLELAISGDAKFIVTGDKDLLVLNPFREISILTPAEFLEIRFVSGK